MADARHFCPDCGSIDLAVTPHDITGDSTGKCPNCSWSGPMSATIGAVTTEQFWDAERVGEVMLRTMALHGAGPLIQCLEFIGLLPRKRFNVEFKGVQDYEEGSPQMKALALYKDPSTPQWNREAQLARDAVMQRIMEAAITAGFEEAEKQNRLFAIATGGSIHPMLRAEPDKVRNIKTARKKKR